jgi:hypothetical protein
MTELEPVSPLNCGCANCGLNDGERAYLKAHGPLWYQQALRRRPPDSLRTGSQKESDAFAAERASRAIKPGPRSFASVC